jgi:flagellar hook-basal body complex protein FliE
LDSRFAGGQVFESITPSHWNEAFRKVPIRLSGPAGETKSVQAVARKACTLDVASAINNAELTLQSVVAVRDRVIQAYQEVIRMPI